MSMKARRLPKPVRYPIATGLWPDGTPVLHRTTIKG
jgi:hypothetical protein